MRGKERKGVDRTKGKREEEGRKKSRRMRDGIRFRRRRGGKEGERRRT